VTRDRRPDPPASARPRRPVSGQRSGGRRPYPELAPPPLTRRQARGILAGLGAFAIGFAAAGVLVTLHLGGTPAYWCLVSAGLLGVGALGISSPRTPADAGRPPVWSRAGLTAVADPLGLPWRAVAGVFYALVAVGLIGNVVLPIVLRGR
jgi:hypothetical protein